MNTERTFITDEETRVARLCSRLHSCLPRPETKAIQRPCACSLPPRPAEPLGLK